MRQKIGFRVDVGNVVGLGHLMEVIAIYKNLRNRFDLNPIFITVKNNYVIHKLHQIGIENIYPIADNMIAEKLEEEEDIDKTIAILKDNHCNYLIVDLPSRTEHYYKTLYENIAEIYTILDNNIHRKIASSLVVNFSISQKASFYDRLKDRSKYLIGTKYVPLNESILEYKPIKIKRNVKRIFINQGGSDPYGITIKIIKSLERMSKEYSVDILVGGLMKRCHEIELKKILKSSVRHKYSLYENVPQQIVYEKMEQADIAITAAGNTLYELAYFGIPSIMIAPRVEFLAITKSFEKFSSNINLGLKDYIDEDIIRKKTDYLITNYDLRQKISAALKTLIDGRGTSRVSDRIYEHIYNGK